MKKLISVLFVICLFSLQLLAQRIVEKNIPVSAGQEIKLEFKYAELIKIKTWDKREVFVNASVSINCDEDNDVFKLEVENKPDRVYIYSNYGDLKKLKRKYILKEDEEGNIHINRSSLSIETYYEVIIPKNVQLNISSISGDVEIDEFIGPLNIKLISGDAEINKISGSLYAKSISGFVDLSLASDQKVDLRMKTVTGEIYTNLEIDFDKYGNKHGYVGSKVSGSINGGGTSIELESVSGNIYLRKGRK